ncbi:hypothetical protein H1O16_gp343 [Burkholderia phage BcepSaruman]|uniref:Uncharacterized protein n=1 Tax=Burkholderia phage BcepSaruman TaxID=2530032 RepID=A0A4D5ZDV1_9CAUD|nr:hypothetical protein H1O16_gp343 [Burkholderia phage BcepSaruman]QBX06756.1 hypothetical protein BcepSaruman_343 [Burkholderia phage BcepSaruman]
MNSLLKMLKRVFTRGAAVNGVDTRLSPKQMEIMVLVCAEINYRNPEHQQFICSAVTRAAEDLDACTWFGLSRSYRRAAIGIQFLIDRALNSGALGRWIFYDMGARAIDSKNVTAAVNQCRAGWLETIIARGRIE